MLPVAKKSKCTKRMRRAHHALVGPHLVTCPKCGKMKLPHFACGTCGFVNRKLMLATRGEEA